MPIRIQRVIPPEDWIKRQLGNLKAVGEANYKVGISVPRAGPVTKAKAKAEKYYNALKKVIDEKRFEKGLAKSSDDEWYNYADALGAVRLVEGVVKREGEVRKFVQAWHPMLLDHLAKIDAMPDVTDKDREDRMLENLRGLKAMKFGWVK